MINKESYEGMNDQINLLLNLSLLEVHKRYEFVKSLLLNTYNKGRWDLYIDELERRIDEVNRKIKGVTQ